MEEVRQIHVLDSPAQGSDPALGSRLDSVASLPDDRREIRSHGGLWRLLEERPAASHQWIPGGQDDPESSPFRRVSALRQQSSRESSPAASYFVTAAKPIRLPRQASEPEPDRCVVRGAIRDYENRHPGPDDIALVVEVADSSLAGDRQMATQVYGPAGILVYWIVNLVQRQVEVYTSPGPQGYGSCVIFTEGQSIPVVIDGQPCGHLAVADILPSRHATPETKGNGD